jgi:hypothetical protein
MACGNLFSGRGLLIDVVFGCVLFEELQVRLIFFDLSRRSDVLMNSGFL